MEYLSYTLKGQRQKNEDCILVHEFSNGSKLLAIADGMGGYTHGEVAAEIVLEAVKGFLDKNGNVYFETEQIIQAFSYANEKIKAYRLEKLNGEKMGATLAIVLIQRSSAICAWTGDCRIYYFEGGKLIFQSIDHTLANEWRKKGLDNDFPVAEKYQRIVTRSLMGEEERWKPSIEVLENVKAEAEFLLCTDGVNPLLLKDQILEQKINQQLDRAKVMGDNASWVYYIVKFTKN